jgi:hypothetical protein
MRSPRGYAREPLAAQAAWGRGEDPRMVCVPHPVRLGALLLLHPGSLVLVRHVGTPLHAVWRWHVACSLARCRREDSLELGGLRGGEGLRV